MTVDALRTNVGAGIEGRGKVGGGAPRTVCLLGGSLGASGKLSTLTMWLNAFAFDDGSDEVRGESTGSGEPTYEEEFAI